VKQQQLQTLTRTKRKRKLLRPNRVLFISRQWPGTEKNSPHPYKRNFTQLLYFSWTTVPHGQTDHYEK